MDKKRSRAGIFVITLIIVLPFFQIWGEKFLEGSEKTTDRILFLPEDDEIMGWKKDGTILRAPQPTDLYKILNGGATLYLKYGFQSFCAQTYKDSKDVEIEVSVFDQGTIENAHHLYRDPLVVPKPARVLENLGDEARVDERGLFHYGIEFIKDRYFVRVIIQQKTEKGLDTAVLFSRFILQRIKSK
jgi:hypothetical protein